MLTLAILFDGEWTSLGIRIMSKDVNGLLGRFSRFTQKQFEIFTTIPSNANVSYSLLTGSVQVWEFV